MSKNLVIVESPAKAKTIEGYLGKDFIVKSSYGHVRDLPKDNHAIDVKNGFKPTYEIPKDKNDTVKILKQLSKSSNIIYLASDDDREGEAISWHLSEALNLEKEKTKRIVFREITKKAIEHAINHPRNIDLDLVNAQQARRILDRLVGFELSPILWEKIKSGLSAGRVQSVAVRLVVEREKEISAFTPVSSFKVTSQFDAGNGKILNAELSKRFDLEREAYDFLELCKLSKFSVESLETKPSKRSPSPPFTTSTLQQEASRKLGFSLVRTMSIAQKLYESGKISYMRTDSLNLSDEALKSASQAIISNYGKNYLKSRKFKTKNQSAQEAHEAIRPTNFDVHQAGENESEKRLYELIWKRTIASQMAEALLEKTTATINISNSKHKLIAKGEVIKFEGFLKVYIESTDEESKKEKEHILPPLTTHQILNLKCLLAKQIFSRPSPRYTEASLVKKLEELGIGRPSTYAPTISTIQKRNYVEKDSKEGKERISKEIVLISDRIEQKDVKEITGAEKNKMFPTNTAMVVNDFLIDHFPNIVNYHFTADVEEQFDDIARGKIEWNKMIDTFYESFHKTVEETSNIDRASINQARVIGTDPKTNKKVYAQHGKYGAYVQLGELEEDKPKPQRASLKHGQFLNNITLSEALELFKLPKKIGTYEGKDMTVSNGKFGPYIKHNDKFVSLKKEQDMFKVTEKEAIQLIVEKREFDANRFIKVFEEDTDLSILKGRFGPYIKYKQKNVKIPKGKKPEDLTYEECKTLAENAPEKKRKWVKR